MWKSLHMQSVPLYKYISLSLYLPLIRCATTPEGIAWRVEGDSARPLLFLVPGGAGQPFPRDYTTPFTRHFFVATYDACSVRDSSSCTRRTSWQEMVADAETVAKDVLRVYGQRDIHLCGFSGGGFIALDIAANLPRVKSVLLISPVGNFPVARQMQTEVLREWIPWVPWASFRGYTAHVTRQLILGVHCLQPTASLISRLTCTVPFRISPASVTEAYAAYDQRLEVLPEYYSLTLRGTLHCPVHIFSGEEDRIAPPGLAQDALRAHIQSPHKQFHAFPDAAHHIRYEREDLFATTLDDFFRNVTASR